MNFSAWSIRNPIAPILAFVILMFAITIAKIKAGTA